MATSNIEAKVKSKTETLTFSSATGTALTSLDRSECTLLCVVDTTGWDDFVPRGNANAKWSVKKLSGTGTTATVMLYYI